jgi:hypothetical protein
MKPVDDPSRSLVPFDQESAVVAVIELSLAVSDVPEGQRSGGLVSLPN